MLYRELVVIFVGGGFGASVRYLLTRWLFTLSIIENYAWAPIMLINVLGSFIMGALYVVMVKHLALNAYWRGLLMVGVLGGFTTFSSFSLDTLVSIESGNIIGACLGVILSVAGSLFMCALGISAAKVMINIMG